MYVASLENYSLVPQQKVFECVGDLVNYYHTNYKGQYTVEVYEAIELATGETGVGEFMFDFLTEGFGDLS